MEGEIPDIVTRCMLQVSQVEWDGEWCPTSSVIGGCHWNSSGAGRQGQKITISFEKPWPVMVEFLCMGEEGPYRMTNMTLNIVYEDHEGFWMRVRTGKRRGKKGR